MPNNLTQHFSPQQTLAIRKELLLTRTAFERTALVQASAELRVKVGRFNQSFNQIKWFRWFKWLIPQQTLRRKLSKLSQRYPLLSSVVSLLLTTPKLLRAAGRGRPLIRWGILAVAAWQSLRLWHQRKK